MVIFDFDGTLLDSNNIKISSFYDVLGDSKNCHKVMDDVLHNASGDRYSIWRQYVLQKEITVNIEQRIQCLVDSYSVIVKKRLAQAYSMQGAISLLSWLKENKISSSLSSATPLEHLLETVDTLNWSHYFTNIFGAPQSKLAILKFLQQKHKLERTNMLVVGDGPDDMESALQFGCEFLPVHEARGVHPSAKVYNLLEIIEFIKQRQKKNGNV